MHAWCSSQRTPRPGQAAQQASRHCSFAARPSTCCNQPRPFPHPPLLAPQIFSRTREGFSLVEERQEMPSLKEVALEVLPRAAAAAARR